MYRNCTSRILEWHLSSSWRRCSIEWVLESAALMSVGSKGRARTLNLHGNVSNVSSILKTQGCKRHQKGTNFSNSLMIDAYKQTQGCKRHQKGTNWDFAWRSLRRLSQYAPAILHATRNFVMRPRRMLVCFFLVFRLTTCPVQGTGPTRICPCFGPDIRVHCRGWGCLFGRWHRGGAHSWH